MVEGGQYVSPEFLMGQVYDGDLSAADEDILYRPVYVCVKPELTYDSPPQTPVASTSKSDENDTCISPVVVQDNGHLIEKQERCSSV